MISRRRDMATLLFYCCKKKRALFSSLARKTVCKSDDLPLYVSHFTKLQATRSPRPSLCQAIDRYFRGMLLVSRELNVVTFSEFFPTNNLTDVKDVIPRHVYWQMMIYFYILFLMIKQCQNHSKCPNYQIEIDRNDF